MTMFAEALKSTGNTLHSTAPDLYVRLLRSIPSQEFQPPSEEESPFGHQTPWSDVCCGVLTSAIHHSTPETFTSMADAIVAEAAEALEQPDAKENPWRLSIYTRLFGILAGVRRGGRVTNWSGLVKAMSDMLKVLSKTSEVVSSSANSLVWEHVVVNVAIVWSNAPVDALIPSIQTVTAVMTREPLMKWFIPFCSYYAALNADRFRSLLQSYFQK
jgi:U3 small nucleolar RNA-associated protein 20